MSFFETNFINNNTYLFFFITISIATSDRKRFKMILTWKSEFELGIEKIDIQHMRLISLINRLEQAKLEKKDDVDIEIIFTGLEDYASYHFRIEEQHMHNNLYNNIETHIDQHRLFTEGIAKLKENYFSGESGSHSTSINLLCSWMVTHIYDDQVFFSGNPVDTLEIH